MAVFVFCFFLPKIGIAAAFNYGQTHNINWNIDDDIEVGDDFFGTPTILNFYPNGATSDTLVVYGHSNINLIGGMIAGSLLALEYTNITVAGGNISNIIRAGTFFSDPISASTITFIGTNFVIY